MNPTIDDKEIIRIMEKTNALMSYPVALILNCLSTISKGDIIEIGTFIGGSAIIMGKGINKKFKVITIDPHIENYWISSYPDIKDTYPILKKNILDENLENIIIPIKGKSEEVYKKIKIRPGMIYIDGCHNYNEVLKDFILWESKLKIGGIICFHDTENYKSFLKNEKIDHVQEGPTKLVYERVIKSNRFKNIIKIKSLTIATKIKNKGYFEKLNDKRILKDLMK